MYSSFLSYGSFHILELSGGYKWIQILVKKIFTKSGNLTNSEIGEMEGKLQEITYGRLKIDALSYTLPIAR